MNRAYEIRCGPHRVAVHDAPTALLALVEYLRGAGCGDADIVRLGDDRVAWRGAVYRARVAREPVPARPAALPVATDHADAARRTT